MEEAGKIASILPEWYTSIDVYTLQVFKYVLVLFGKIVRNTFLERTTLADVFFRKRLKRQRKAGGLIQEQLAEAKFETLMLEGRAMTIEQTVTFALEKSDG